MSFLLHESCSFPDYVEIKVLSRQGFRCVVDFLDTTTGSSVVDNLIRSGVLAKTTSGLLFFRCGTCIEKQHEIAARI